MLLYLKLLALVMELNKNLKYQLGRKNLNNNWNKKIDYKNNQWFQSNLNLFLNTLKKIFMKKLIKSKKDKENKDCNVLDCKVNKKCNIFLLIYFQNQKANLSMK